MEEQQQQQQEEEEEVYLSYDFHNSARKFPEFSTGDIDAFIETFKNAGPSGAILEEDLGDVFIGMGHGASAQEIKEIFQLIDTDKSGAIEWPEFLAMMRLFYGWKVFEFAEEFLVPALDFPEFTTEEIISFTYVFRQFDEDNSGTIDMYELNKVFKYMGQGASEEELSQIFAEMDGEIRFGEFLAILGERIYPYRRLSFIQEFYEPAKKFPEFNREDIDSFVQVFRKFDVDGSGGIDADELFNVFKAMGQGVSKEDSEAILKVVDLDGSGEVEWPEFLMVMRILYPWKLVELTAEFYLPAMAFPEFTHDDITVFIQSFKEFDLDGSGSIDAEELSLAFRAMGQGATPESIRALIQQVDLDGSGEIEWVEFLLVMRILYPHKLEELKEDFLEPAKKFTEFDEDDILVFVKAFRLYDLDGSGGIDAKELKLVFQSMGQGCTKQQLDDLITKYDTDGSGEIEWMEFLQIMSDLYKGRDIHATSAPAPASTPAPAQTQTQTQAAQRPAPVQQKPASTPQKPSPSGPATSRGSPQHFNLPPGQDTTPKKVVSQSYLNVGKTVPLEATDKYVEQRKRDQLKMMTHDKEKNQKTTKRFFFSSFCLIRDFGGIKKNCKREGWEGYFSYLMILWVALLAALASFWESF